MKNYMKIKLRFVGALVTLLPALCPHALAQNGHRVQISIRPFANKYVYLGYHFGNSKPISDSIKLDKNGSGAFAGKEKLKPGIYLLGYPDKKQYIELLIEKSQQFSVTADTANAISTMVVKNSPEGIVFQSYQKYMEKKAKEVMQLEAKSKRHKNKIPGQPAICHFRSAERTGGTRGQAASWRTIRQHLRLVLL
jgi:hypothetical protein